MKSDIIYCQRKVAILMAVYNGEKYLSEQIESLLKQTYKNWMLYVQDDLSTDKTLEIVRSFTERDDRIKLVPNRHKRGSMMNFMSLLQLVDADYYMFADQDDVWLPQKIELSLKRLLELEKENPGKPVAVHTDLTVVDEGLTVINDSLWRMLRIEPSLLTDLNRMGAHCLMTGCTMIFDKKVKEVSLPISQAAVMHDIWITLCVFKNKGVIGEINYSTILYRQHGENTVGAKDFQKNYVKNKLKGLKTVWQENLRYYNMLRLIGYGSVVKYIYNKINYYFKYNSLHKNI